MAKTKAPGKPASGKGGSGTGAVATLGTTIFSGGMNFFLRVAEMIGESPSEGLRFAGLWIITGCILSHGLSILWIVGMFILALSRGLVIELPALLYVLVGSTLALLLLGTAVGLIGKFLLARDAPLRAAREKIDKLQADLDEAGGKIRKVANQLVTAVTLGGALKVWAKKADADLKRGDSAAAQNSLVQLGKVLPTLKAAHTVMNKALTG